ncbi:anthranilate synthase component I family protein [Leeuwenhoekiella parthenopeia]|uniref:Anthranilate synthase component I family protein n=1 Tax=Leeuwenhoekiella parthenopeia TaxID=2890320 RepID=A0ABS8GTR5_9FLAO|nr:anthranilate synthase component I family protein [Leeuwenhoekiella parthenopeia]MCC4212617.1 anthranilate synthase component I family protein [Leeuwenhoekiella parthenopeia]
MRAVKTFSVPQNDDLPERLLHWASQDSVSCLLTSNAHKSRYGRFELLLGVGVKTDLSCTASNAFQQLSEYRLQTQDWILGFLTYDLKNEVEMLQSDNPDALYFPDLYFFQPLKLVKLKAEGLQFLYLPEVAHEIDTDYETIFSADFQDLQTEALETPKIKVRFNKDAYCAQVSQMLEEIKRGTIYEANFCQEFYAEAQINPIKSFLKLNAMSRAPFAAYFRLGEQYALCSSPERYLQKAGTTLISQPIKGTSRRGRTPEEDFRLKQALENDPKERSENIMITDLVRNDLSRVASKGSVQVEELCRIYTFEQVHQMITTVSAKIPSGTDPVLCLKHTFPMGSMTGAPKISAMQIIERLENRKRGLYSGSIGYFTPEDDFDFNVVIRSILYNAEQKYLSFTVGSAITARAVPENEYEECLIKAKAMRKTLES